METYDIARFIHIVSSTVLFGTGLGTAFHMWMTHLSGDVNAIARATRNTVIADWIFTTPAILIQPASGLWLVYLAGHDIFAPWLAVTYLLYLLAGACWVPVVMLQIEAAKLARDAAGRGDGDLPERYHVIMRRWFRLGWPAFISLLVIFALMVTKPDFGL